MSESIFHNVQPTDYLLGKLFSVGEHSATVSLEDFDVISSSAVVDHQLQRLAKQQHRLTYFTAALESNVVDPDNLDDIAAFDFVSKHISLETETLPGLEEDGVIVKNGKRIINLLRKGIMTVINFIRNSLDRFVTSLRKFTRAITSSFSVTNSIPPTVELMIKAPSSFKILKKNFDDIYEYATSDSFKESKREMPLGPHKVIFTEESETFELKMEIEKSESTNLTETSVKGIADYARDITKEFGAVDKRNDALTRRYRKMDVEQKDLLDHEDGKEGISKAKKRFREAMVTKLLVTKLTQLYYSELNLISRAIVKECKAYKASNSKE